MSDSENQERYSDIGTMTAEPPNGTAVVTLPQSPVASDKKQRMRINPATVKLIQKGWKQFETAEAVQKWLKEEHKIELDLKRINNQKSAKASKKKAPAVGAKPPAKAVSSAQGNYAISLVTDARTFITACGSAEEAIALITAIS